jgi:hypothetical protein
MQHATGSTRVGGYTFLVPGHNLAKTTTWKQKWAEQFASAAYFYSNIVKGTYPSVVKRF